MSCLPNPSFITQCRSPLGTRFLVLGSLLLLATLVFAQEDNSDPTAGPAKYLGVVTCAGSTCHGAPHSSPDARVLQSEFITWHRDDAHAKAYRVLLEEKGQRIAQNLGLKSAAGAPECLNCHANNAPVELRGKRFQIADGVGCETCHGPASKWLGLHVTGEASREENLKAGMYRTEDPSARATLCLSCHLGANNKFATHRIMGAGHPRLSFELDTFTMLQPAHYRVDADYRSRKQVASHVQVWAIGQAAAAKRTLDLFLSEQWQSKGVMPEFAFFDCQACHHPMDTPRWAPRETAGLPPGVVRLNDANLLMLLYLTKAIEPALADELHSGLLAMHKASTESLSATQAAAKALQAVVTKAEGKVRGHGFKVDQTRAILTSIVKGGIAGDYRDYAAAEQAVMAIHALTDSLRDSGATDAAKAGTLEAQIRVLYTVLENQNAYDPARLQTELATLDTALN
jgi:Cytochrome c554 and c-prime